MKQPRDAKLRNGRQLQQTKLEQFDESIFTAYYDDLKQFKRYSGTIDQHIKTHRRETRVKHLLEEGSTIETHDIQR